MSKREQEKAIEDTKKVAEQAKSVEDKLEATETLQEVGQQAAAQEIQQTYRRSLDETKENVRKSIDEARTQIPKYTNVVKSYQEQALESTGAPYYVNTYRMYNYWFSPRVPAELWARTVSNIVENIASKVGQNLYD